MAIKSKVLREAETPERTRLYEVRNSRYIAVEERQDNDSLDQVILEYCIKDGDTGYFAKEYRPDGVKKMGSKVIDITAVMLNHDRKCVRWHLYDIKDTLAGEHTVVQLHDQWNAGLMYLQQSVLDELPEYSEIPHLGVITRCYDEKRMIRLRDDYQRRCEEIENVQQSMTLAQRKRQTQIAKYRATYKAVQAILDRSFQTKSGDNTYNIQIRQLHRENEQIYKAEFPI